MKTQSKTEPSPLLSDTFALTRVINLRDRTDRYAEVSEQLRALGMSWVPGKVEVFTAERQTELGGFDTLGARGNFLSHLKVLRDARDRGVESVLVVEDDCEVLAKDLAEIGKVAARLQGRAWEIAYLGHRVPALEAEALAGKARDGWVEFSGPVETAHLYAVRREALGPLVEYLESCLTRPGGHPVGGPMLIDGALTMFRAANPKVVTLLAEPMMAIQRSSRSDITFRSYELVPGIKQALRAARVVRRRLQGRR